MMNIIFFAQVDEFLPVPRSYKAADARNRRPAAHLLKLSPYLGKWKFGLSRWIGIILFLTAFIVLLLIILRKERIILVIFP